MSALRERRNGGVLDERDYYESDQGFTSPCWVRRGTLNSHGYGLVLHRGRRKYAHRVMYEQERGPIPAGLTIDHLCRNRACMRPDHLEIVSRGTNIRRGRATKITAEVARQIRSSHDQGRVLAKRFGLSEGQISRIRHGLRWTDA